MPQKKKTGRPSEYGEPTKKTSFRYPASKEQEFKEFVYSKLATYKKKD